MAYASKTAILLVLADIFKLYHKKEKLTTSNLTTRVLGRQIVPPTDCGYEMIPRPADDTHTLLTDVTELDLTGVSTDRFVGADWTYLLLCRIQ